MMINKRNAIFVFLLGALITFATITNAFGQQDGKWITGASCMARDASEQQYLGYHQLGVVNKHTDRVMVTCPIEKDANSADTLDIIYARITQAAWNSTRCYLRTGSQSGGATYVEHKAVTGSGYITFNPVSITVPAFGTITFQCRLAPNATLYRIGYYEGTPTD